MIRALALCAILAAPASAQTAPQAHVDQVVEVFLTMDCVLNPLIDGAQAEKAAGLDTLEFSQALAVLEASGKASMDDSTFEFRLNHKDCP